jgi:RimJ/RimL family protein N-acetyltransferase
VNDLEPPGDSTSSVLIPVSAGVSITEIRPSDRDSFIKHLNDRGITDNVSRIPFPYNEADADRFLAIIARSTAAQGRPVNFAIRNADGELINADGELIGGCGLDGFEVGKSHRAELGYWLARPYWGRGIMTDVVRVLCDYAFAELGLEKIIAYTFERNLASSRVLEKCGFELEGRLRRHIKKDGELIDVRLYALFKPDGTNPNA